MKKKQTHTETFEPMKPKQCELYPIYVDVGETERQQNREKSNKEKKERKPKP